MIEKWLIKVNSVSVVINVNLIPKNKNNIQQKNSKNYRKDNNSYNNTNNLIIIISSLI